MNGRSVITFLYIFMYIFICANCDSSWATLVWKANNVDEDAETLYKAMKGWGTREGKLIEVLAGRTSEQRRQITAKYEEKYHKTLEKDLEDDTSHEFLKILRRLTYSMDEFLARELSLSLTTYQDHAYLEIICTCDEEMMNRIKASYMRVFEISLAEDIENRITDIPERLLLLRLLGGSGLPARSREGLDDKAVNRQVKSIPENKENCLLEKNGEFFTLLSKGTFAQIRTVVEIYNKKHENDPVSKRIKENCEDEYLRRAYSTIISYAEDPVKYFAKLLKDAMDPTFGAEERVLDRVIIWRSEIDLAKVAQSFYELTNQSLESRVKRKTSGDTQNILLALIKGNKN